MIHRFFSIFKSSDPPEDTILDWPEGEADKFEFYRDFFLESQAADLMEVFNKEQLPFQFEEVKYIIDPIIVGQALKPKFILKIRASDFERANRIWEQIIRQYPALDVDHYLHDFSTKELLSIVNNPESWSLEDVVYSKIMLEKRGILLDDDYLKQKEKMRIGLLKKGKNPTTGWMVVYFIMALTGPFIHVFLCLTALGMGWYYWKDATLSEKGEKFPTFNKNGRTYGQFLFFTSGVTWGIFVVFSYFIR